MRPLRCAVLAAAMTIGAAGVNVVAGVPGASAELPVCCRVQPIPDTSPDGQKATKYGVVSFQIVGTGLVVDQFQGSITNITGEAIIGEVYVTGPDYVSPKQILVVGACSFYDPWQVVLNRKVAAGNYWVTYVLSGALGSEAVQWDYSVHA